MMRHNGASQTMRRFGCRLRKYGNVRALPIHPAFRHQEGVARLN